MNFRKFLLPFSFIYNGVTSIRNYLYDTHKWESSTYEIPIISVGNLSVGGTGKSPMIEYLLTLLHKKYKVAVLSRGYGRKTKGYREVFLTSTSEEVGDEPLQFKQKFKNIVVSVCANRREGIEQLKSRVAIILLDDAFQHRKVKPSYQILLTSFDHLFTNDYLLPAGNLRESHKGFKRADVIMVTKCPDTISLSKMEEIKNGIQPLANQSLYFTKIDYSNCIYNQQETLPLKHLANKKFALITGIAKPKPLVDFLINKGFVFTHEKFPDHYAFKESDIKKISKSDIVLTTEKDYMRLKNQLNHSNVYYLPIKTTILNGVELEFNKQIFSKIDNFLASTDQ